MEICEIRRRALRALLPPPKLRLSEWIEANVILPAGASALPGPMRLWTYQRAIADSISDPEVERVSVVKSVRIGFTSLMTAGLASFVANEPAPILCLLPTESDARDYTVSEIEPLFEASPSLHGLLSGDCEEGGRNTLLSRRFAGGSLKIVASRAPRNLRRHTARILLCDEVDAFEVSAEGDPLKLAERRTLSFGNRKIICGSTPIFEDSSPILRLYAESDQRVFEIRCVECGCFTEILWEHIEWEPDHPQDAAFRCPHCGALVAERYKAQMVSGGRWRALRPEVQGHHGYRLNALVSSLPGAAWGKLAAEFLLAKSDPAQLQTFVNTILARGWRSEGSELDESDLASRVEAFGLTAIPESVLAITAGVDCQDDRLEVTLAGWTRAGECLVLAHVIVWGAISDDLTFVELDELLKSKWRHPLGGFLRIDACAIDAGSGGHYDKVMAFCAPRAARRIMGIKGVSGFARPAIQASKSKLRGGGRLWLCGVDVVKAQLYEKIARGRMIRFSADLEASYFEQLASERIVVKYSRGKPTRQFARIPGKRAESLDALCYATSARAALTISWDSREAELRAGSAPPAQPQIYRSRWMTGA